VLPGETGVLVAESTVDAFAAGMLEAEATPFAVERLRAHAETFGAARFEASFSEWLDHSLTAHAAC
jgi:hypothetical protein